MSNLLCVNIDHIATIRQARLGKEPSLMLAAIMAEEAGADGITIHLREDRRHIQDQDLFDLKKVIKGIFTLEMAASEEILELASQVQPNLLTLVPEKREELTTEGGLNIKAKFEDLKKFILKARQKTSAEISLFIEADEEDIKLAKELAVDRIEIHTGTYSNQTVGSTFYKAEILKIVTGVELAKSLGLKVNAGHGLNIHNLADLKENLDFIEQWHIGHSIIARSLFIGLSKAVEEIKTLL